MQKRKSQGWVYGQVYNPEAKTNPSMLRYAELPLAEQAACVTLAGNTVASALAMGYSITKDEEGVTQPNARTVQSTRDVLILSDFLAENAHDLWAAGKIETGWKYGKVRDDAKKTHPMLLPFVDLQPADAHVNQEVADTVLITLRNLGYSIASLAART